MGLPSFDLLLRDLSDALKLTLQHFPSFSGEPRSKSVPLQFPFIFLVFCAALLFRGRKQTPHSVSQGLHALVTVFTPSQSIWPQSYTTLVENAPLNTVTIPLDSVIKDVTAGAMEFRDAQMDLADLLRDRTRVYGWRICLRLEMWWWVKVASWISLTQITALRYTVRFTYFVSM